MANPIVHWELMGPDGDAMVEFYSKMFGWSPQGVPGFDNYYMVDDEQAGLGGAVGTGPEQMPSYMTFYIQVDSIDDHLAQIGGAGGSTVMPRTVVPGIVTFALFSDPAGNTVGIVEAETPPAE